MTRLVTMVALVAVLATATTAQATEVRPSMVDECREFVDEPLSNPERWQCRGAVSNLPEDVNRDVHRMIQEIRDHRVFWLLP